MLRITTERRAGAIVLHVEGRLAREWAGALEQCWRELRATSPKDKFSVNLCGVSFIDGAGKVLLKEIHRRGGHLIAEGCLNQAIVNEIVGDAIVRDEEEGSNASTQSKPKGAVGKKGSHIIFYLTLFSLCTTPGVQGEEQAVSARAAVQERSGGLKNVAPKEVLKLTLDGAVALGLKQNPTAQIAVLNAAESVQDKNIARSALLPQAQLEVSDSARRTNLETNFGRPLPGFPRHVGPVQIFQAGPSFGTPIFDLTLFRRYQAARDLVNAGKANIFSAREQVVLLVVSQYIGTLRAVADVSASQSRVELAQALYDQAADVQKEGIGTGIDTLRANVQLQNEKQRLIEAEADRERSLFGLSRLLNLDPRQKIELADSLSFFDTPQPEEEASIELALGNRAEWKALEAQLAAADHQKKAARDSRLPALRADGNWAYQGISSTTGIPTYNYQASVSMPLFTSGRIHAEIARAGLEIQKLEQQRDDLRDSIALDVKTALISLNSARNEVQVANLGVRLSKDEVDQARDRFRAGVANNIEVIQAQDALARANDNEILALYRFNQAHADYARAIGQMEKVYAK